MFQKSYKCSGWNCLEPNTLKMSVVRGWRADSSGFLLSLAISSIKYIYMTSSVLLDVHIFHKKGRSLFGVLILSQVHMGLARLQNRCLSGRVKNPALSPPFPLLCECAWESRLWWVSNVWSPAWGWSRGEWPGSSISLVWSALWQRTGRLGSHRTGWTW